MSKPLINFDDLGTPVPESTAPVSKDNTIYNDITYAPGIQEIGEYDEGFFNNDPTVSQAENRAQNQTNFQRVRNGLAKAALSLPPTVGHGFSSLVTAGVNSVDLLTGEESTTAFSEGLSEMFRDLSESAKEAIPVHQREAYHNGDAIDKMFSSEGFGDFADGLSFMASAFISGGVMKAGVTAGVKALGRKAISKGMRKKVNQKLAEKGVKQGIDQVVGLGTATFSNTISESLTEAAGIYDEVFDELRTTHPGKEGEWYKAKANEAAHTVMRVNMGALIIPNFIQSQWFFGKLSSNRSTIKELIKQGKFSVDELAATGKGALKAMGAGAGEGFVSEALWEENIQNAVGSYAKRFASGHAEEGLLKGVSSQMASNAFDFAKTVSPFNEGPKGKDAEGAYSIMLGAAIGGGASSVSARSEYMADAKYNSALSDQMQGLLKDVKSLDPIFQAKTESIYKKFKDKEGNETITNPDTGETEINPEALKQQYFASVAQKRFYDEAVIATTNNDPIHAEFVKNQALAAYTYSLLNHPNLDSEDVLELAKQRQLVTGENDIQKYIEIWEKVEEEVGSFDELSATKNKIAYDFYDILKKTLFNAYVNNDTFSPHLDKEGVASYTEDAAETIKTYTNKKTQKKLYKEYKGFVTDMLQRTARLERIEAELANPETSPEKKIELEKEKSGEHYVIAEKTAIDNVFVQENKFYSDQYSSSLTDSNGKVGIRNEEYHRRGKPYMIERQLSQLLESKPDVNELSNFIDANKDHLTPNAVDLINKSITELQLQLEPLEIRVKTQSDLVDDIDFQDVDVDKLDEFVQDNYPDDFDMASQEGMSQFRLDAIDLADELKQKREDVNKLKNLTPTVPSSNDIYEGMSEEQVETNLKEKFLRTYLDPIQKLIDAAKNLSEDMITEEEEYVRKMANLQEIRTVYENREDIPENYQDRVLDEIDALIKDLAPLILAARSNANSRIKKAMKLERDLANSIVNALGLKDPASKVLSIVKNNIPNSAKILKELEDDNYPLEGLKVLLALFKAKAPSKALLELKMALERGNDADYALGFPAINLAIIFGDKNNGLQKAYLKNPNNHLRRALASANPDKGVNPFNTPGHPLFVFQQDADVEKLYNALVEPEFKTAIEAHRRIVGRRETINLLNSDMEAKIFQAIVNAIEDGKYPSLEQFTAATQALRYALGSSFASIDKMSKVFYTEGTSGAGKSFILAPLVTKAYMEIKGISKDEVLVLGHTPNSAENIAEAIFKDKSKGKTYTEDLSGGVAPKFIIFDESNTLDADAFRAFVAKYPDTPIYAMGDPSQMTKATYPLFKTFDVQTTVPLTSVYRSNVLAISKAANSFKNRPDQVSEVETTSNVATIGEATVNKEANYGVINSSPQEAIAYVKAKEGDGVTRIIIAQNDREASKYQAMGLESKTTKIRVLDADAGSKIAVQGLEAEEIIMMAHYGNMVSQLGQSNANRAYFVGFGRAKSFVISTGFQVKSIKDPSISTSTREATDDFQKNEELILEKIDMHNKYAGEYLQTKKASKVKKSPTVVPPTPSPSTPATPTSPQTPAEEEVEEEVEPIEDVPEDTEEEHVPTDPTELGDTSNRNKAIGISAPGRAQLASLYPDRKTEIQKNYAEWKMKLVEEVIASGIRQILSPEDIIKKLIALGYVFENSTDAAIVAQYINSRIKDYPKTGNNKQPFHIWRKGKKAYINGWTGEAIANPPNESTEIDTSNNKKIYGEHKEKTVANDEGVDNTTGASSVEITTLSYPSNNNLLRKVKGSKGFVSVYRENDQTKFGIFGNDKEGGYILVAELGPEDMATQFGKDVKQAWEEFQQDRADKGLEEINALTTMSPLRKRSPFLDINLEKNSLMPIEFNKVKPTTYKYEGRPNLTKEQFADIFNGSNEFIQEVLKKFVNGFYALTKLGKVPDKWRPSHPLSGLFSDADLKGKKISAKIYSKADLETMKLGDFSPKPGLPYLVIEDKSINGKKMTPQHILLSPRPLSKSDPIAQELGKLTVAVKELEEIIEKHGKIKGATLGTFEFNAFIRAFAQTAYDVNPETLEKTGRAPNIPDVIRKAQGIAGVKVQDFNWITEELLEEANESLRTIVDSLFIGKQSDFFTEAEFNAKYNDGNHRYVNDKIEYVDTGTPTGKYVKKGSLITHESSNGQKALNNLAKANSMVDGAVFRVESRRPIRTAQGLVIGKKTQAKAILAMGNNNSNYHKFVREMASEYRKTIAGNNAKLAALGKSNSPRDIAQHLEDVGFIKKDQHREAQAKYAQIITSDMLSQITDFEGEHHGSNTEFYLRVPLNRNNFNIMGSKLTGDTFTQTKNGKETITDLKPEDRRQAQQDLQSLVTTMLTEIKPNEVSIKHSTGEEIVVEKNDKGQKVKKKKKKKVKPTKKAKKNKSKVVRTRYSIIPSGGTKSAPVFLDVDMFQITPEDNSHYFRIEELEDGTALLHVADDKAIQRSLANQAHLQMSANYLNSPQELGDGGITVTKPGILIKTPEGWEISEKMEIYFGEYKASTSKAKKTTSKTAARKARRKSRRSKGPSRTLNQNDSDSFKQSQKLSMPQAQSTFESYLGKTSPIETKFLSAMALAKLAHPGEDLYGLLEEGVMYLRQSEAQGKEFIYKDQIRHEVFHVIWQYYLTENEKTKIEESIQLELGLDTTEISAYDIEEALAIAFHEWRAERVTFGQKLTDFFKKLASIFGFVYRERDSIKELFRDIENGVFQEQTALDDLSISPHRATMLYIKDYFNNIKNYKAAKNEIGQIMYDFTHNPAEDGFLMTVPEALEALPDEIEEQMNDLKDELDELKEKKSSKKNEKAIAKLKEEIGIFELLIAKKKNSNIRVYHDVIKDLYPAIRIKDVDEVKETNQEPNLEDVAKLINHDKTEVANVADDMQDGEKVKVSDNISMGLRHWLSHLVVGEKDKGRRIINPKFAFFQTLLFAQKLDFNSIETLPEQIAEILSEETLSASAKVILTKLLELSRNVTSDSYINQEGFGVKFPEDVTIVTHHDNIKNKTSYHLIRGVGVQDYSISEDVKNFQFKKTKIKSLSQLGNSGGKFDGPYSASLANALYKRAEAADLLRDLVNNLQSLREMDLLILQKENNYGQISFSYFKGRGSGLDISIKAQLRNNLSKLMMTEGFMGNIFLKFTSLGNKDPKAAVEFLMGKIKLKFLLMKLTNQEYVKLYDDIKNAVERADVWVKKQSKTTDIDGEEITTTSTFYDWAESNDSTRLFNTLAKTLQKSTEWLRASSMRDSEGKVIYKFNNSSYSYDMFQRFIENGKNKDKPLPIAYKSKFMSFNPFVNGQSKIHAFEYHDAQKFKGSNFATGYSNELHNHWYTREMIGGFLGGLSNAKSKDLSYYNYTYPPADRARVPAMKVSFLSPQKAEELFKNIQTQRDSRKDMPYFKKYNRDSDTNATIKHFHHPRFTENEEQRAKILKKELAEELRTRKPTSLESLANMIAQDMIDNKVQFPDDIQAIAKKAGIEGQGQVTNKVKKEYGVEKAQIMPSVFAWVQNNYVNSYYANQLIMGDYAHYNHSLDVVKRFAGPTAPGQKPWVNDRFGMPKTFKVAIGKDIEQHVTTIKTFLKEMLDSNENFDKDDLAELYSYYEGGYDETDAGGFITPARFNEIKKGFANGYNLGHVLKPQYFAIQEHWEDVKGKKIPTTEPKPLVTDTQRVETITIKDENDVPTNYWLIQERISKPVMLKYAAIVLSDDLLFEKGNPNGKVRFPELLQLRENMEEKGIGEMLPASGIKTDMPANLTEISDMMGGKIDITSTFELDSENYRLQLNPYHAKNKKPSLPTQLMYFLNVYNTDPNNDNAAKAIAAYNAVGELLNMGLDNFKGKYNGDPRNILKHALSLPGAEVLNRLYQEGVSHEHPSIEVKSIIQLLSSIANSTFKKVNFSGDKLMLQTSAGMTKPDGTELKIIKNPKGGYIAETFAPKKLFTKDQIAMIEAGKDLYLYGDAYAFRIPSTELHSAIPLKVVGFYDTGKTPAIVVPKEIVPLHGSDFDADALFIITREVFSGKESLQLKEDVINKNDPIGYIKGEDGKKIFDYAWIERNNVEDVALLEMYYKNVINEVMFEMLGNPKNMKRVLKPISLRYLKLLAKKPDMPDLSNPMHRMKVHESIFAGRSLTGIFANGIKVLAYIIKAGSSDIIQEEVDELKLKQASLATILGKDIEGNPMTAEGKVKLVKQLLTQQRRLEKQAQTQALLDTIESNEKLMESDRKLKQLAEYLTLLDDTTEVQPSEETLKEVEDDLAEVTAKLTQTEKLLGAKGNTPFFKTHRRFTWEGKMFARVQEFEQGTRSVESEGKDIVYTASIWDTLDALVNAAIDNAKEQVLFGIGASQKTANSYIALVSTGMPLKNIVEFMTHPSIDILGSPRFSARKLGKSISELKKYYDITTSKTIELTEADLAYKPDLSQAKLSPEDKAHLTRMITFLENANAIGEDYTALSSYLGIANTLPVEVKDMNRIQSVRDNDIFNKELTDTKKGFSIDIPNFFEKLPHIRKANEIFDYAKDIIESQYKIHSDTMSEYIKKNKLNKKVQIDFSADENRIAIKREFAKYVLASIFRVDPELEYKYKHNEVERTLNGSRAWAQKFIQKLEVLKNSKEVDLRTNYVLQHLTITGEGIKQVKFSAPHGLEMEDIMLGEEEFMLLNQYDVVDGKLVKTESNPGEITEFQKEWLKFAAIQYGLDYGGANFSKILPPEMMKPSSDEYVRRLALIISKFENPGVKDAAKLKALLDDFEASIVMMNADNLPYIDNNEYPKFQTNIKRAIETSPGKYTFINDNSGFSEKSEVYYDLGYDIPDEVDPHDIFKDYIKTGTGATATAYMLVKLDIENGKAYYQKMGRNRTGIYDPIAGVLDIPVEGEEELEVIDYDLTQAWVPGLIQMVVPSIDSNTMITSRDLDFAKDKVIRIYNSSDQNRRSYRDVQVISKEESHVVSAYDRSEGDYGPAQIYKYTLKDAQATKQDVEDAEIIDKPDC